MDGRDGRGTRWAGGMAGRRAGKWEGRRAGGRAGRGGQVGGRAGGRAVGGRGESGVPGGREGGREGRVGAPVLINPIDLSLQRNSRKAVPDHMTCRAPGERDKSDCCWVYCVWSVPRVALRLVDVSTERTADASCPHEGQHGPQDGVLLWSIFVPESASNHTRHTCARFPKPSRNGLHA